MEPYIIENYQKEYSRKNNYNVEWTTRRKKNRLIMNKVLVRKRAMST